MRSNRGVFAKICCVFLLSASPAALGAEAAPAEKAPVSRDALLNIGRAFAKKIGAKLEEAEILLRGGDKLKLAQLRSGNVIPEGELLILRGYVGVKKLRLGNDMLAMVMNQRLMVSLGEFVTALDFAISVSPEKGTAAGWYIREDQTFLLDVNKGEITLRGETARVSGDDVVVDGQDILVSSMLLEQWFGIDLGIDLTNLALQITSSQPLPVEERARRAERSPYAAVVTEAKLPLLEEPRRIAGKPYLDVTLGTTVRKPAEGNTTKNMTGTMLGAGDLAGLTSQTFIGAAYAPGASNDYIFNNVRQTFSRDDPDGKLYGIKYMAFGDVDPVSLPLVTGAGQEQGVRLSNRIAGSYTSLGTADVEGDAQPGWDVELYRNDNIIGQVRVGGDGRYEFPSVFLFAGMNKLKLVFYGPQGEIREETREIYSGAGTGTAGGAWDIAATRGNITTYNPLRTKTEADGDLRLTAKYEHSLGTFGAGRLGVASFGKVDTGKVLRKNYLQSGFSAEFMNTLLTADSAYDTDGAYAGNLVARRNFGRHQTGLTLSHESKDFSADGSASLDSVQALANGPLAGSFLGFTHPTYSATGSYLTTSSDLSTFRLGGSLGGRMDSISLSAGLDYTVTDSAGVVTPAEDRLSGALSARGAYGRGRWRTTAAYDVQPLALQSFFGSYTYPFTSDLEGVGEINHDVATNLTRVDLSANWLTDKFALSPRLSVDNERSVAFNTSLRFALAPNPYSGDYEMYRQNLSATGGVAARVFLDKNGDGIFNEGEQLIEESELRSVQSNRRALTNARGVAFIPDLARGFRTDVMLNASSLPDPYYMSMDEGASLLPRPGVVTRMEFPVVVSGEMDGQAGYGLPDGASMAARNIRIMLVAPDGTVAKAENAAYDGYWTLSGIRPGVYYLTAQPGQDSQKGYMLPRRVDIGPEGTTLYGEQILLQPGHDIPFRFSSVNPPPVGNRKTRVVKPEDLAGQEVFLELGNFTSRLGLTFAWYKFRMKGAPFNRQFALVTPLADIAPDPITAHMTLTLKPHTPITLEGAADACLQLIDRGHECGVHVVTRYRDPALPQQDIEKKEKKAEMNAAASPI